jgi:glucosamine-6-phosphate deaminase
MTPTRNLKAGNLTVNIYENRVILGAEAAKDVATKIKALLSAQPGFVNIIFAAAPSQSEFLYYLSEEEGIDWARVNGFHMDEYVGVDPTSPQSFAWFLRENIFDKLPFHEVFYINGNAQNSAVECDRYTTLLEEYPTDIVCMGIGENTHIAFNDPHTANFNDPMLVKLVTLDEASRQQQVHDGCFADIASVPTSAITLTVPALLRAASIFCMVPGSKKAWAVSQTIHNEVSEKFPSTSLKKHAGAILYLDRVSAENL